MSQDLSRLSLFAARQGLESGHVTSRQLTEACLEAIERRDGRVNSFLNVEHQAALRGADEADRARKAGQLAPLLGLPLAHKDMYYRQGRVSTCGSTIMTDQPATTTATVLERLDQAGALELGALNMSEFAAGPTGHNAHYGDVHNPWNTEHISGGSSSGPGAAVAARLCYGALGSDTGASIRVPAACCGVVGLKPTYGRISRYGAMPRSWSNDCMGPLARTVMDCALLMQVLAGRDTRDSASLDAPVPDYLAALKQGVRGLRVGIPTHHFADGVDDEIAEALSRSRQILEQAGCHLVDVDVPDPKRLYDLGETLSKGEASTIHRRWMQQRPQDYSDHVRSRLEAGQALPATRYLEALSLRAEVVRKFVGDAFEAVDVLHLPVLDRPVPTLAETDFHGSDTVGETVSAITRFTRPINYLGLPSLSVPCGFSQNGLPIGFQLVGRPLDEDRLLAIGHAYQQLTEWHHMEPEMVASN
ncbi:amidase [Halomonas daqingensis]|uniref:Amidase n=1 Tax=Billgrantia desiderata TaxID=52021 RepID=A0ABS9B3Z0_9GAMM|nr:amidase [Halomonas desiderata]MCE8042326.1 amidase [Halomonas desiderata]MCE8046901.1 amidase [Halomonas desiderata]